MNREPRQTHINTVKWSLKREQRSLTHKIIKLLEGSIGGNVGDLEFSN